MLVGSCFVQDALGPAPTLDLTTGPDTNTVLHLFAHADILSTICLPNRRPAFTFVRPSGGPSAHLGCHSGLPGGLLILLAETSALSVDMLQLDPGVVRDRADQIEREIKGWSSMVSGSNGVVGIGRLDATVSEEMWRLVGLDVLPIFAPSPADQRCSCFVLPSQTALIHLATAVRRLGPLSRTLQSCLADMLALGAHAHTYDAHSSPYENAIRACPWTIASMLALTDEDQATCRAALEEFGPQQVYKDNLAAVEAVWEQTSSRGWTVNWREVLAQRSMVIAFQ